MTNPISDHDVVVRRDEVLANELSEQELVMLDADRGIYFGLREVGKVIWSKLAEPISVSDLRSQLLEEFDVDDATCRQEVSAFLDELREAELIDVHPAAAAS